MKHTFLTTATLPLLSMLLLSATDASAADEILRLEFNDGTVQTFNVEDIHEMTFGSESTAAGFTGDFTGINTCVVGNMFTYTSGDSTYNIQEEADGTLTVNVPEFSLAGTVMGDLTLGAYTVKGLTFDETAGTWGKNYGDDGLTMTFKAMQNGTATMDNVYPFKTGSEITLAKSETGITITNKFQIGNMPFELVVTFDGTK